MPSPEFSAFIDDYFNALFDWAPTWGTAAGFHKYDTRIENYSAGAQANRIESLTALQARLTTLRGNRLPAADEIDADILDSQIRAELLDLKSAQGSLRNPMNYVELPGSAVDALMKRSFAPARERLRSLIARLDGIPDLMNAMRENVSNPPKEFSSIAMEIAAGSTGFFEGTVAAWARDAAGNDTALLSEFTAANLKATQALHDAAGWIETRLLPNSTGSYAIGAEAFAKKLLYEEMIDTPLDELLAIGQAALEKDYQDLIKTTRDIDPAKSPAEVMKTLAEDHPDEQSLIPEGRSTVDDIVRFIVDRKIVTIPAGAPPPTIMETPPYARSGVFASMDTPGAYETAAKEAFYYITPPESDWDARHKDEHLSLFNGPVMKIITIHEAYPGHYLQFLYAGEYPTKTRKLLYVSSNVEGWAHYAEQMMVEEGFGGGDPKIRLAQLSEALLRDVRFIAGIKLHTEGWTVEQAAKLFEEKGFQEPANALAEARRGAYNPTYLYYTLGKIEIYRLRDDYRKAKGSAYSLEKFHDDFVKQGGIPIKLIRRILLPT